MMSKQQGPFDGKRITDMQDQSDRDRLTISDHRAQRIADVKAIFALNAQAVTNQNEISDLRSQADTDHAIIEAMAGQGVLDRAEIANLEEALATSRRIGAAMGILMATYRVTEQAAFVMLRSVSQNTHRKLRDIADDVLYAGTLDTSPSTTDPR